MCCILLVVREFISQSRYHFKTEFPRSACGQLVKNKYSCKRINVSIENHCSINFYYLSDSAEKDKCKMKNQLRMSDLLSLEFLT